MAFQGLINIRKALTSLNPHEVREMSERPVRVALHAGNQEAFQRMEDFFLRDLSPSRRRASAVLLSRATSTLAQTPDVNVFDEGITAPPGSLIYHADRPGVLVDKALAKYPDLGVSLAKSFCPFRRPFVERVINKTCRENTLFSITTALPDVIPNVIELPWAVAEFASDTAFLTMNQVRMAFLIAGASDRPVGYSEQKSEIAAVIGSAFGWRALSRQVIGKIPFGGGLIGKAGVAYAGTKVVGMSLERFYNVGYTYSREEREEIYADAFRHGKSVAAKILDYLRPDLAARFAASSPKGPLGSGKTSRVRKG